MCFCKGGMKSNADVTAARGAANGMEIRRTARFDRPVLDDAVNASGDRHLTDLGVPNLNDLQQRMHGGRTSGKYWEAYEVLNSLAEMCLSVWLPQRQPGRRLRGTEKWLGRPAKTIRTLKQGMNRRLASPSTSLIGKWLSTPPRASKPCPKNLQVLLILHRQVPAEFSRM
ncbi:MAG: hypothetical protein OXN84_20510 [Albidovulum sp.]|nr:hypothetical protein [Albidovulum sp.]